MFAGLGLERLIDEPPIRDTVEDLTLLWPITSAVGEMKSLVRSCLEVPASLWLYIVEELSENPPPPPPLYGATGGPLIPPPIDLLGWCAKSGNLLTSGRYSVFWLKIVDSTGVIWPPLPCPSLPKEWYFSKKRSDPPCCANLEALMDFTKWNVMKIKIIAPTMAPTAMNTVPDICDSLTMYGLLLFAGTVIDGVVYDMDDDDELDDELDVVRSVGSAVLVPLAEPVVVLSAFVVVVTFGAGGNPVPVVPVVVPVVCVLVVVASALSKRCSINSIAASPLLLPICAL